MNYYDAVLEIAHNENLMIVLSIISLFLALMLLGFLQVKNDNSSN